MLTVPVGLDNIVQPSDDTKKVAFELAALPPPSEEGKRKWRRGEMEFEALMRHLDNAVSNFCLGINKFIKLVTDL